MKLTDERITNEVSIDWSSNSKKWSGFEISQQSVPSRLIPGSFEFDNNHLYLIIKGQSLVNWSSNKKNHKTLLTSGTFTYFEAGYKMHNTDVATPLKTIDILLDEKKIYSLLEKDDIFNPKKENLINSNIVGRDPYITRLIQSMATDVMNGCLNGKTFGESASIALLIYLYGVYSKPSEKRHLNGLSTNNMKLIDDYIRNNLSSDLSLLELAELVHLSPRHFCRSFKEVAGIPPHQYILLLRIETAKELLRLNRQSITEIAYKLGFSSSSHFSDAFKKITGHSPKQFSLSCSS